jgi:hypothetical protein
LEVDALRTHDLHLKRSKCTFGAPPVTYLGHVISANGVTMDSDKVDAVSTWPDPRLARGMCGFLGLDAELLAFFSRPFTARHHKLAAYE